MVSHRMVGRKFGRKSKHRIALGRNILKSLIEHGRITTTLPKAKEYRPRCEKIITLGRVKTLHNIRLVASHLNNDRTLTKKLFDEIGPRFKDRQGGYLRIRRLARPRVNDNAPRAILEFIDFVPVAKTLTKDAEPEQQDEKDEQNQKDEPSQKDEATPRKSAKGAKRAKKPKDDKDEDV